MWYLKSLYCKKGSQYQQHSELASMYKNSIVCKGSAWFDSIAANGVPFPLPTPTGKNSCMYVCSHIDVVLVFFYV